MLDIPGLGVVKLRKIFGDEKQTIQKLRKKEIFAILPPETKLFLTLKPLRKIPHAFIESLEADLEKNKVFKKWKIVGSYRRERPTSRDIDIVVVRPDIQKLMKFYDFEIYQNGPDKYAGYLKWRGEWVKIDIFDVDDTDYPFMIFYGTGSRDYNIVARKRARELGWKLNQHGLYDLKTEKKISYRISDEEEIFKKLKLTYRTPVERDIYF